MNKKGILIITILALIMTFAACLTGCGKEKASTVEKEDVADTEPDAMTFDTAPDDTQAGNNSMSVPEPALEDRIASMNITYVFGDQSETLDGSTISGWLYTKEDGTLSVNEAPAKEYVAGLASKYDTFGRNRSFTTHDGQEITVAGGDYGYWMDRVSTREQLIDQILTGESATLEPVYYGTGKSFGEDDIGNTYVEINIGQQHLWVYRNGEQINDTDFVSGGLFKGNGTPEGTYAITYKERDATLVGEGYQSSVKYWMPFNGNIGLHDASWRDAFGGHIYYMNGSHGCVNLPTTKAAEIYDQVEKGEPVVVYGSITKDEAISTLTLEEMATAAQKGYIPMTTDIAEFLFKQQGFDDATAAALAAAQTGAATETQEQAPEEGGSDGSGEQPHEQE